MERTHRHRVRLYLGSARPVDDCIYIVHAQCQTVFTDGMHRGRMYLGIAPQYLGVHAPCSSASEALGTFVGVSGTRPGRWSKKSSQVLSTGATGLLFIDVFWPAESGCRAAYPDRARATACPDLTNFVIFCASLALPLHFHFQNYYCLVHEIFALRNKI